MIPSEPRDLPPKITKDSLKGCKESGTKKKELFIEDFPDGYVLMGDDIEGIWNSSFISDLPDSWKKKSNEKVLDNFYQFRLPTENYLNKEGFFSLDKIEGYQKELFIPYRFNYDSTSGVIFDSFKVVVESV